MESIRKHHQTMNYVIDVLAAKWHIGFIAAVYAWMASNVDVFFSDNALKFVGGASMYMGAFIAALTLFIKLFDAGDVVKKRRWFKRKSKK